MRDASKAGFKVYLYFIATEDPAINIDRVDIRVKQGGHAVPADRITERYYRSLDLLPEAIDLAYHAFIFDNSGVDPDRLPFGEYKVTPEYKSWWWQREAIPDWFIRAYLW